MSKIISDEQMVDLAFNFNAETGEAFLKPYLEFCVTIATAQRDSSDKEWMELVRGLLLYEAHCPPVEGEEYTYLGSYILKWGKEPKPSVGLREFDWQTLTQKEA